MRLPYPQTSHSVTPPPPESDIASRQISWGLDRTIALLATVLSALGILVIMAASSVQAISRAYYLLIPLIGLVTWWLPPLSSCRVRFRLISWAAVALPLFFLDPTLLPFLRWQAHLTWGPKAERERAFYIFLESGRREFSGANLEGLNLSDLDLSFVDFQSANLRNAQLDRTILVGSNFTRSDLQGSTFRGVDLTATNLLQATSLLAVNCDKETHLPPQLFCEDDQLVRRRTIANSLPSTTSPRNK